jgi:small subunit ribosomal protein S8e
MAIWQGRSKRKPSGGILRSSRKKRKFEIGREKIETTIGKEKYKKIHTRGGNQKIRVIIAEYVNVVDKKTKKTTRTKISSVLENPANPHYVRRNIITKGAIVQTEIGRAKITSRPGQDRILNAILIEELKEGLQTPKET